MGFFGDITGGSILGGLMSFGAGAFQNAQNKKMMREQMRYNTAEREASQQYQTSERLGQQAFQTRERVAQNQFSEDMYTKYQSPQALAKQYMDAGLDPRMAMGNGQVGSISASSGSSGGAPSSGAPSGRSVSPPYQDVTSLTSGFVDISNALKSLGEAKKVGIETALAEATFGDVIKKFKNELKLQDLEIDYSRLNNAKARKSLRLIELEIDKENKNLDLIDANLKILQHEGVIKGYEAEHWLENFRNEQNRLIAETDLLGEKSKTEKTQQSVNKAHKELIELQKITEGWNAKAQSAYKDLLTAEGRLASIEYDISNATKGSEIAKILDANGLSIETMENHCRVMLEQAELLNKQGKYYEAERIASTILDISLQVGILYFTRGKGAKMLSRLGAKPIGFNPVNSF